MTMYHGSLISRLLPLVIRKCEGESCRENVDTLTVVMSCLQTNGGSIGGRPSCSILKS